MDKIKNKYCNVTLLVVSFFLLVGCSAYKELKIGNIRSFELKGMKNNVLDVEITIPVENPNVFKVKLNDADFKVTTGKTLIGTMKQVDDVVIASKSTKDYPLHVKVELTGFRNNLMSIYSLLQDKPDLRLTGTIKVRSLLYRKKIEIKDYQLIN